MYHIFPLFSLSLLGYISIIEQSNSFCGVSLWIGGSKMCNNNDSDIFGDQTDVRWFVRFTMVLGAIFGIAPSFWIRPIRWVAGFIF